MTGPRDRLHRGPGRVTSAAHGFAEAGHAYEVRAGAPPDGDGSWTTIGHAPGGRETWKVWVVELASGRVIPSRHGPQTSTAE